MQALSMPIVWSILFYRAFISKHKGYRCAYSGYGYGESCSTYGLKVFSAHTPWEAYKLLKQRFLMCTLASRQNREFNSRHKQRGSCCNPDPYGFSPCDICDESDREYKKSLRRARDKDND
jgi:putative component of membrane protein insertase Oxa1/YidC/SpoIIIJ protein YidD